MPTKITHLTSAHPRYDTRIFLKESTSLAKSQHYRVTLVVADGEGDEEKNGVTIIDVGAKSGGRLSRMTKTVKRVYQKAVELDSDIYHLHDPELMPLGLKLKKRGKKVIFDAHEDLPKQLLTKPYLTPSILKLLSKVVGAYEAYACRKFDGIITATPYIRDKFLSIHPSTIDINNFPILGELEREVGWEEKGDEVCYVGAISAIRGIKELVQALAYTKEGVRLNLAGRFNDGKLEAEVKSYETWEKVNALGYLNRQEIATMLRVSKAGVVTLYPTINYRDALPVKMFEYMLAGVPVISSDIPLWQAIVKESRCGLCVNPLDPQAIAHAINFIIDHPKEAEMMGKNGKEAVLKRYNWQVEEKKLLSYYEELKNGQ
jgi:glycosyltransferase involved in cell wall biosynthesis